MRDSGHTGASGWEHYPHQADMGVRGWGATPAAAFEQAAVALTAVIAEPARIAPATAVEVTCSAPDLELLFADWLNAIIYEMATRHMLFSGYRVHIEGTRLQGTLWGEPIDALRHDPAVEVKGATYTDLKVAQDGNGTWVAQCVVDV